MYFSSQLSRNLPFPPCDSYLPQKSGLLNFLLQTFLPCEQQVPGSWISHQILLLHFSPIFPFLNISFHWAWILRILFRSAPQICQLSRNLHRWSIFMSFTLSLCWCSTDRIKNCSSLRSVGVSVLEQAAIFLISRNTRVT